MALLMLFLSSLLLMPSCDKEEVNNDPLLQSFGPSPALRGGELRFIGQNLGEVTAVIFPGVEIGAGCRLRRVVIDKGCKLPEGMVIGENADEDARRFHRSEQGIVLVTKPMLDALAKTAHKQAVEQAVPA